MSAAAYQRVSAGRPMAGPFLARQTAPVAPIIESITLIWAASEGEEWQGKVRYVPF